jgi:Glycosyl hydrolases family 25
MTIFFPDIASYQAGLDLAGALVVLAKATEGLGYTNPEYGPFHTEAARHGTFFCAYHFLSAGNGAGQAAHAHSVIGGTPAMLDFEPAGTAPSLADAVAFIDAYRKAGGTCWLCYLPRWYWQQLGSPDLGPLRQRGMLLVSSNYAAGYTDANSGAGWASYGGMTPTVWQYSSTTPFNRQRVDFNAYRGSKYAGKQDAASVAATLAEFRSLATTGKLPGTPPPPPPATGPVRHEVPAGNTQTWAQLCKSRNVTQTMLATFSLSHLGPVNAAVLTAYLALCRALEAKGAKQPPMPAGLVYWTVHP